MPKPRLACLFFAFSLLFHLPALGQEKVPPDRGYIQGGAYHNVRFGFRLKIPEGWDATTAESADLDSSVDAVAKDETSAAQLKAASATTYRLVTLTKPGSRESLRVLASDILLAPSIKTPEDALEATEAAVKNMTALLTVRVKEESVEINGHQVVTRWLHTTIGKAVVPQTITAFLDQGYMVQFVGSFETSAAAQAFDLASALTFLAKPAAGAAAREIRTGPLNGSIVGNQYKNDFFKLTMTFPEDWEVQEPEVMKRLQAMAQRMTGKKELPESSLAPVYLVSAMPRERGAILLCFFQNAAGEEIPSLIEYLKGIAMGIPSGEWLNAPKEITLQGRTFVHGAYSQRANDLFVTHLLYVTVEKPYILVWDVAAAKEELRKVGRGVIEGMLFPVQAEAQNSPKEAATEPKK